MASDTVPAALPGPDDQAGTTPTANAPQQPGGLTGLLAAVDPARPQPFSITPTTEDGQAAAGASSAAYHDQNTPTPENPAQNSRGSGGNSRQERSVVRAWLLAGADRWKKNGDARLKRLDIKKARAQAHQVKETVTVNRSENNSGGGRGNNLGGNSGNSGKNAGGNTNKHSGSRLGGGSNGSRNNSSGRSGGHGGTNSSGSKGPSGGGGGQQTSKDKAGGWKKPTDGSGTKTPKNTNGPGGSKSSGGPTGGRPDSSNTGNGSGKGTGTGKGSGAGKGSGGGLGGSSKDSKSHRRPNTDSSSRSNRDQNSNRGPSGGSDKTSPAPKAPASDRKPHKTGKDTSGRTAPSEPASKAPRQTPGTGAAGSEGDSKVSLKKDRKRKPNKQDRHTGTVDSKDGKDSQTSSTEPRSAKTDNTPDTTGRYRQRPRINTRASRETGYRDGTRAGRLIAHTEAWRDGYRDGYRDVRTEASQEKQRLDEAHAQYQARTQPLKDEPVTQPASSADYQPTIPPKPDQPPTTGPQAIHVTGTDTTHVHLGDSAARPHISRGEIRTLRTFQEALNTKSDVMIRVTEATHTLEQHANEQTKQVTEYLEQARGVEGGDKLIAALAQLQEAAQTQAIKAADTHQRALRASEACQTLNANTETRYGGIYQAVVDAPENRPAKMTYYQEMAGA